MNRKCACPIRRYVTQSAIVTILACTFLTANAQPRGNLVADAYSQMHGVSVREATRRLGLMQEAGRLEQRLRKERAATFAGLYVEHEPQFRIVVRFTQNAKTQLSAFTHDPVFIAQPAPRSLELLSAVQDELDEQLHAAGLQFESGLDVKGSKVHVFVLDPVRASRRLAALMSVTGFISIEETTGFMEVTGISGGNQLTGPEELCTSGFNVVHIATREL